MCVLKWVFLVQPPVFPGLQLPKYAELNDKQLAWARDYIMERAGKQGGFAHVGGKAVDLAFRGKVDLEAKRDLVGILNVLGLDTLNERVKPGVREYGVDLKKATVLHVTDKP